MNSLAVERHGFLPVAAFDAVVLPFERDAGVVEREQPRVGDRDAVGVAREIGEHGLWAGERALGVDDPFRSPQRRERSVEGGLVGERRELAEEGEAACGVKRREPVQEQPAEQARQHAHGQEEAGTARDPARAVGRQAAAGNDDVDVRMMGQRRAPGMQDSGQPDARAQMLGIGGDRGQRLGGGAEQEIVDGGLVLECDLGDRRRQGEDDVVIGDWQQLGLALGEPLPRRRALTLRAMPIAAGVVGDAFMRAVLAALDVAAERGCATGFDRRHDLQLREARMAGVGLAPCGPVDAKDVGDLQKGPRHAASVGGRRRLHRLEAELVERAGDDADRIDGDAGVERRRLQFRVTQ